MWSIRAYSIHGSEPEGENYIYLYNELLEYPSVTNHLSHMVLTKKIKNLSLHFVVEDQFSIVSGAHLSVIELGFVRELKADLKE